MCWLVSTTGLVAAQLGYRSAPADNPLKGFMPYAGVYTNFPHSLEWTYFQLKDVQSGYQDFRWSFLDNLLNRVAGRGHQAVFRTYLDYPNVGYGVPDFLSHVPKRAYSDYDNGVNGTSFSPDYNHPDLRRALTNFIAALGARYDGDPRIGFITIGLLGFWGEWHTFPYNGFEGKPDWFASSAVQKEILDAWTNAFRRTKLLVREPKDGLDFRRWPIGYHDDSFAFSTLTPIAWHFWPRITSAGLQEIWRTQAIGGEIRPEIQRCMWEPGAACVPAGQGYEASVATTHASWMLNQGAFDRGLSDAARQRAIEGAGRLGYELSVVSAEVPARRPLTDLPIALQLTNHGVAPFYYPWPVRLGLLSAQGQLRIWTNSTWDLTSVLPRIAPLPFTTALPLSEVPAGDYQVLMNVSNPLPNGKPLRFANQEQDQTLPAWLSLSRTRVGGFPRVAHVEAGGNQVEIDFAGLTPGWNYGVEMASTLAGPEVEWIQVDAWTAGAIERRWLHTPLPAEGGRFFRLVER